MVTQAIGSTVPLYVVSRRCSTLRYWTSNELRSDTTLLYSTTVWYVTQLRSYGVGFLTPGDNPRCKQFVQTTYECSTTTVRNIRTCRLLGCTVVVEVIRKSHRNILLYSTVRCSTRYVDYTTTHYVVKM